MLEKSYKKKSRCTADPMNEIYCIHFRYSDKTGACRYWDMKVKYKKRWSEYNANRYGTINLCSYKKRIKK